MARRTRGYVRTALLGTLLSIGLVFGAQMVTMPHSGSLAIPAQSKADSIRYEPLTYRDDQWMGSTFWTGPDWTRVGKNWQHPGEDTPSVRSFECPRDGRVTVTGNVRKADTGGGDGVRVFIRHNSETVWNSELRFDDAVGVSHRLTMDVRRGDMLRFVVHKLGIIAFDSTYWDPEVTYTDGASYKASEGFKTALDPATPWRYEMQTAGDDPKAAENADCRLYAFTNSLLVQSWDLDKATAPVRLSSVDYLPVAVVARRAGHAGTVVLLGDNASTWQAEFSPSGGADQSVIAWKSSAAALRTQPYTGDWHQALNAAGIDKLFSAAYGRLNGTLELPALDPAMWSLVAEAWAQEDRRPSTSAEYTAAATRHLERALLLAYQLKGSANTPFCAQARGVLTRLLDQARATRPDTGEAMRLYVTARRIKRELLLRRPEYAFGRMLFCKCAPTSYSHEVMQYFGWRARAGGGLFVLDRPGYSVQARDILKGRLAAGSVLQPSLSYDGRQIAFSFVENAGRAFDPDKLDNQKDEAFYHIWTVNADGTNLRQRTSGPYEDLMPVWLPNGDLVFSSTRRKGYSRCFGPQFSPRWHSYTIHRLAMGSGQVTQLSANDVSEWFPVVAHDGMVYYSRWDYIDRDAVTHQSLWSSRPDGANPTAVWGNGLPSPDCTFQMQPIPGSRKFVLVASAHHSITAGSLVVLDPQRGENAMDAIRRVTPSVPFPESETSDIPEWYAAPWPLADDLFLTAYSPYPLLFEPAANRRDALGIYLLDNAGNRELIYRDPDIGATNPIPLRSTVRPPVVPSVRDASLGAYGEFMVANVYEGLNGVVRRGDVKELRVVQIFPKTTPVANNPPIGVAGEENGRAILGVVPVAPDGSVRFKAPAGKPLLFQLLDKDGRAIQVMRSLTYLQPGERTSCVGCHEGAKRAGGNYGAISANRLSCAIKAGPYDGQPFSYMRVVQPVLDKHCASCHSGKAPAYGLDLTAAPDRGFTRSYCSLMLDGDARRQAAAGHPVDPLVPRFPARNQVQITPPGGGNGARGSLLLKMLQNGHHQVALSADDMRRLAMWIDNNAIFYGTFRPEQQKLQLTGAAAPMPDIQ